MTSEDFQKVKSVVLKTTGSQKTINHLRDLESDNSLTEEQKVYRKNITQVAERSQMIGASIGLVFVIGLGLMALLA